MSEPQAIRKKQDYLRHFTLLDLGSSMVKAAVVRKDEDTATILGVGREPQHPSALHRGQVGDHRLLLQTANRALEAAENMAGLLPGQLIVGTGSQIVAGLGSAAVVPRDRPDQPIRSGEYRDMLALVERRALRDAKALLERSGQREAARLIHVSATGVRVDGVPTRSPLGMRGRNVELGVFNAFLPSSDYKALARLARDLDLELLSIVPSTFAVAYSALPPNAWEQGAVVIDVGGSGTRGLVIRSGSARHGFALDLGGDGISSHIATLLGISREEAHARKLRYAGGYLTPAEAAPIGGIVATDVDILLTAIGFQLRELPPMDGIPADLYLAGATADLPDLGRAIRAPGWREGVGFASEPRVTVLEPGAVTAVTDTTCMLAGSGDVMIACLADHGVRALAGDNEIIESAVRAVIKEAFR